MSEDVYYRVIAKTGDVVTLQDFDEIGYDPSIWLKDFDGNPLKFESEAAASRNYVHQIREVSDALNMIGEAIGNLTIPEDSKFLAHKLVTMFQIGPNAES